MDLRLAIHEFVNQGREILERLRSFEGNDLNRIELHVLEVQLYLLEREVSRRTQDQPPQSPSPFPPFNSQDQGTKKKVSSEEPK